MDFCDVQGPGTNPVTYYSARASGVPLLAGLLVPEDIHSANLELTDEEVNGLIGRSPDTPLPSGQTKWQILIGQLAEDLTWIPLAAGGSEP